MELDLEMHTEPLPTAKSGAGAAWGVSKVQWVCMSACESPTATGPKVYPVVTLSRIKQVAGEGWKTCMGEPAAL